MAETPALTLAPDPDIEMPRCPHCGDRYLSVVSEVLRDGSTFALCRSACYHHEVHEVFCDVIFSATWDDTVQDQLVMTCRIGPEGVTALDAGAHWLEMETVARVLTREETLEHPRLSDLWAVVDLIAVEEPAVADFLSAPHASGASRVGGSLGRAVQRISARRRDPARRRRQ